LESPETFAQWASAVQQQQIWVRKTSIHNDYGTVQDTVEKSQPKSRTKWGWKRTKTTLRSWRKISRSPQNPPTTRLRRQHHGQYCDHSKSGERAKAQSVYVNSKLVEKVDDHRHAWRQCKPEDERCVDNVHELRGSAQNCVCMRQMARRGPREREMSTS